MTESSGQPVAPRRCPACGEQPMSRFQFLLIPGLRARCRRCGAELRLDLSYAAIVAVIAVGAVIGYFLVESADDLTAFVLAFAVALVLAVGFDEYAWRRVAWLPAPPKASAAPGRD
jgi:hypothetical protein